MIGNPDGLRSLAKFSKLPVERIRYFPDADERMIRAITRGILFQMAFWSGPAVQAFAKLTEVVVARLDPDDRIELVVVDIDGSESLAAGEHWVVQEKRGRKVFSRGVWAPAATIDRIRAELEAERAAEGYAKKKEAEARRRKKAQAGYVENFFGGVVSFLAFHPDHAALADRLARAVTDHATPVGSGTVARTKRIPVEKRAEAAVIAWILLRRDNQVESSTGVITQEQPAVNLGQLVAQHPPRPFRCAVQAELRRLLWVEAGQRAVGERLAGSPHADFAQPLLEVHYSRPQRVRVHAGAGVQRTETGGGEVEPSNLPVDPLGVERRNTFMQPAKVEVVQSAHHLPLLFQHFRLWLRPTGPLIHRPAISAGQRYRLYSRLLRCETGVGLPPSPGSEVQYSWGLYAEGGRAPENQPPSPAGSEGGRGDVR